MFRLGSQVKLSETIVDGVYLKLEMERVTDELEA